MTGQLDDDDVDPEPSQLAQEMAYEWWLGIRPRGTANARRAGEGPYAVIDRAMREHADRFAERWKASIDSIVEEAGG